MNEMNVYEMEDKNKLSSNKHREPAINESGTRIVHNR